MSRFTGRLHLAALLATTFAAAPRAGHTQTMTESFTSTIVQGAAASSTLDGTTSIAAPLHAFDKGGKLVSVSISMTTGLEQNAHTFNNDYFSAHGSSVTFMGTVQLTNTAFSANPVYNEPSMLYSQSNGIRSGAYAPANGVYYTPAEAASNATVNPADYALFNGTGNIANLNLLLTDTTNFRPNSSKVTINSFSLRNNVTNLSVTYNYVVPGPESAAVFLPGLTGALLVLKARSGCGISRRK